MLEIEKKKYPVYRKNDEAGEVRRVCDARIALSLSSDRRDVDNSARCVYLKKTYRGICDFCDIKEGDTVLAGDEKMLVISTAAAHPEILLHLESVQIIDTEYVKLEESGDV